MLKRISAVVYAVICASVLSAQDSGNNEYDHYISQSEIASIKTVNGKLYAYTVLLFNENPHFVNIIQKDTIPMKVIGNEGFNVREYSLYLDSLHDQNLKSIARTLYEMYLEPSKFTDKQLEALENQLVSRNIVLKFSRDKNTGADRLLLDYCIYGRKVPLNISHPLIDIKEKIFNIQPFIYYDEFSTSNSTFYYDMIYINPEEVTNDVLIARKVLNGENVSTMFFVGSKVTDNIRYCLTKAFTSKSRIRDEIFRMFVIHELTHKAMNNLYNNYDQVLGEEMALSATISANPYLGLAVLYAYLNYNSVNPHRVAAVNMIKYMSEKHSKPEIMTKPGLIKNLQQAELKKLSKDHFESHMLKISNKVR